jgi:hypothetical protein
VPDDPIPQTPVRSILDPVLGSLEPGVEESVRATLDLFPLAYRGGAAAALQAVADRLSLDERAGVVLDQQRFMAALNGVLSSLDRLEVPDVWAGRPERPVTLP